MGSAHSWRPSPPLVVSMLALFVALSGSAVALTGKGAIDHDDLRKHVVHRGKIHDEAVNGAKVANDSLGAIDLATGSVGSSEILTSGVGQSEVATSGVSTDEIAAGAVGSSEIGTGAVGTSEVADEAVTVEKLDAVTGVVNHDFGSLDEHTCNAVTFGAPLGTPSLTTANLLVSPDEGVSLGDYSLVFSVRQPDAAGSLFTLTVCNATDVAINPSPTAFRYLAILP